VSRAVHYPKGRSSHKLLIRADERMSFCNSANKARWWPGSLIALCCEE